MWCDDEDKWTYEDGKQLDREVNIWISWKWIDTSDLEIDAEVTT